MTERPLRVSFLPMRGCYHSCSFCADNSGKKIEVYPFAIIRHCLEELPFRLESAALYNACDGLAYLYEDRGRRYDVRHLAGLFRRNGCRVLLFSSPGTAPGPENGDIIDSIASMKDAALMLSFNREHLLDRKKFDNFFFTARRVMKHRRLAVRAVYCSPGERAVLVDLLHYHLGEVSPFGRSSEKGFSVETVPAAPLGRGRRLYFGKDDGGVWREEIEEMILGMYRAEPVLREYRYMTVGGYDAFLRHAAVQFSGLFIILLTPTPGGIDVALKVTDPGKTVSTRGLAISTLYRYDAKQGRFTARNAGEGMKTLDLLIFDVSKCTLAGFSEFIAGRYPGGAVNRIRRAFVSFMSSDFLNERCRLNERERMLIVNPGYTAWYGELTGALMHERSSSGGDSEGPLKKGEAFDAILAYLKEIGRSC